MSRVAGKGQAPGATRDRESGQALLELALVTPILVLLVMAIFQFAYVMETQVGLTNAVREAARRAAATTTAKPIWTGSGSLEEWTQIQLCGHAGMPCDGGLLKANVQGFDPGRLWSDPPSVAFCSYSAGGVTQYQVNITVKYRHPLFFAPLAFATDLLDGTTNQAWDLTATAQMRLENIDDSSPFTGPGSTC